jgi:hypothetical protein
MLTVATADRGESSDVDDFLAIIMTLLLLLLLLLVVRKVKQLDEHPCSDSVATCSGIRLSTARVAAWDWEFPAKVCWLLDHDTEEDVS